MKLSATLPILLILSLVNTPSLARDMATKWPFAVVANFPEASGDIGFETGWRLGIGVFVTLGDAPVKSVLLRNSNSGVEFNAQSLEDISQLFSEGSEKPIIFQTIPMPAFDPEKHSGVWDVIVTDEQGKEVNTQTHNLDIVGIDYWPDVIDVQASGDPLTPTISWSLSDSDSVPDRCATHYRVRLLKDIDTQFHRSDKLTTTTYTIPEGVLKEEDLPNTYVRIGFACEDKDEPDMPLEIASQAFILLKTLLEGAKN